MLLLELVANGASTSLANRLAVSLSRSACPRCVRASLAALTARSTESRSTPGMEATGVRRPTPSIRKIGQMRSELASEVSRTILRDHPARRFRRIRVAGKPGPFTCSDVARVRFARSFRNEMGLSFGAVIYASRPSAVTLRGKLPSGRSRRQCLSPGMVCHFDRVTRRSSTCDASSCRDENDPCAPRWRSGRAPCRNGGMRPRTRT